MKESTNESELKRVFADLHITKKARVRSAFQVANIEREALGQLNRVVDKQANKTKLSAKDGLAFSAAFQKLIGVPELCEKYFEGKIECGVRIDDIGSYSLLTTFNEAYHWCDPGRYIGGAREAALIPYPFNPADDAENRQHRNSYLEGLKRVRPKKAELRDDQPTLAAFLVDDEVESADLETQDA